MEGQCHIAILKVADKFSQEHFALFSGYIWQWQGSSGSQYQCVGCTCITQLICRYTASPTPESYSVSCTVTLCYMHCEIRYTRAVLPKPLQSPVDLKAVLCKCRILLFCKYNTDMWLQRNSSENSSENLVIEFKSFDLFLMSIIIGLPRIWVSWGMACAHIKFEIKYFCVNNFFLPTC